MKRVVKRGPVDINGHSLQLPRSKAGEGHYWEILRAIVTQLDSMQARHSRLLVVVLGLSVWEYTPDNALLSRFFRKLRKRVRSKFGQGQLGYIWCREQDASDKQHYHLTLILNGNKNRHPKRIIELVEEIWGGWNQPKLHTPKHCYYLLKRGDERQLQNVFNRLSYIAKVATKGARPKTTNDYGSSRFKLSIS